MSSSSRQDAESLSNDTARDRPQNSVQPSGDTTVLDNHIPLLEEPLGDPSPVLPFLARSHPAAQISDSQSASENVQAWVKFAGEHRRVLATRIEAEQLRRAFKEQLDAFREATDRLAKLLTIFRAKPSDTRYGDLVLKQSYAVATAQDKLDAAQIRLETFDSDLVKQEWNILTCLPQILQGEGGDDETDSEFSKQDIDFRGNISDPQNSTIKTFGSLITTELDPKPNDIHLKLDSINSLESEILRVRDARNSVVGRMLGGTDDDNQDLQRSLDQFDTQENSMRKRLQSELLVLHSMHHSDDELAAADESGLLPAEAKDAHQLDSDDTHEIAVSDPSLFIALRDRLSVDSDVPAPVFASVNSSEGEAIAGTAGFVNSWLFHLLRTSDDEVGRFVNQITKIRLDFTRNLSREEASELAVQLWHVDETSKKASGGLLDNTTAKTVRGDSLIPFSGVGYLSSPKARLQQFARGLAEDGPSQTP